MIDVVTPGFLRIKIQVYSFQIVLKLLQAVLCLSSKTSCLKNEGNMTHPSLNWVNKDLQKGENIKSWILQLNLRHTFIFTF